MKKKILMSLLLLGTTATHADMYKHDLQVFTANTMEIPCSGTPKTLFFGEYEKVAKQSAEEIQNVINGGVSAASSSVGSWVNANGISGSELGKNIGAGLVGAFLGNMLKNAAYASMDDPEYLMISECNSGKNYTRLITMVVSNETLSLAVAEKLAKDDQRKMARKVNR